MMDELTLIQRIVVWILPVIFAITVHEVAHGWMAKKFGDNTADQQGRLTLNPLKHIDPLGTIIVPGLLLITFTGFIFGWAKPVPVDARNFKNPKKSHDDGGARWALSKFVNGHRLGGYSTHRHHYRNGVYLHAIDLQRSGRHYD
jgi:Zn-dependent protease